MNAMLIALPFMGFQVIITTMFQSIGKGKPSMILSMARQGYFLIPLLLILPDIFGLNGIIYAQPIADILTLVLTIFMFVRQIRDFKDINGPQDDDKIKEPAV
jgi:Na+-driven multidrug efflux pump